jgi:hypothetical protein
MKVTIEIEVDDRAADDELLGGLDDDTYGEATEFKVKFSSTELGKLNLALLGNLTSEILAELAKQNAVHDPLATEPEIGELLYETADMLGYQLRWRPLAFPALFAKIKKPRQGATCRGSARY